MSVHTVHIGNFVTTVIHSSYNQPWPLLPTDRYSSRLCPMTSASAYRHPRPSTRGLPSFLDVHFILTTFVFPCFTQVSFYLFVVEDHVLRHPALHVLLSGTCVYISSFPPTSRSGNVFATFCVLKPMATCSGAAGQLRASAHREVKVL